MTGWTITALGWQYAVRRDGELVQVYDTRPEADAALRQMRGSGS